MRQVSPVDTAWVALESRDTPMHVGGLYEFTPPEGAPADYLKQQFARMRSSDAVPPPWNLKLVSGPLVGPRLPLMREVHDIDLDYHVRHSALPHPGGQRELGVLVSRLHGIQLDPHRPLWEMHLIEGLESEEGKPGGRFALYMKIHHSLIDGVSGMRLAMRALSTDPDAETPAFWAVGEGARPPRDDDGPGALDQVRGAGEAIAGLGRAAFQLGRAAVDDSPLAAPYRAPQSALGGALAGQRRFATQQYDLARVKALAKSAGGTLNDLVLYLSGTALRHYLLEHGRLPERSLTAGIPVSLREAGDESTGTNVGMMVADIGTDIANPRERLAAIVRSTTEAKAHLQQLPSGARTAYGGLITAPWVVGLLAGMGGRMPIPFNVGISNVPGPPERLYFNGSTLDAIFPLSLLMHGNALNITCLSYAGTLNFGFTGARDNLPHLQGLAIYMGEAVEELESVVGVSNAAASS